MTTALLWVSLDGVVLAYTSAGRWSEASQLRLCTDERLVGTGYPGRGDGIAGPWFRKTLRKSCACKASSRASNQKIPAVASTLKVVLFKKGYPGTPKKSLRSSNYLLVTDMDKCFFFVFWLKIVAGTVQKWGLGVRSSWSFWCQELWHHNLSVGGVSAVVYFPGNLGWYQEVFTRDPSCILARTRLKNSLGNQGSECAANNLEYIRRFLGSVNHPYEKSDITWKYITGLIAGQTEFRRI